MRTVRSMCAVVVFPKKRISCSDNKSKSNGFNSFCGITWIVVIRCRPTAAHSIERTHLRKQKTLTSLIVCLVWIPLSCCYVSTHNWIDYDALLFLWLFTTPSNDFTTTVTIQIKCIDFSGRGAEGDCKPQQCIMSIDRMASNQEPRPMRRADTYQLKQWKPRSDNLVM